MLKRYPEEPIDENIVPDEQGIITLTPTAVEGKFDAYPPPASPPFRYNGKIWQLIASNLDENQFSRYWEPDTGCFVYHRHNIYPDGTYAPDPDGWNIFNIWDYYTGGGPYYQHTEYFYGGTPPGWTGLNLPRPWLQLDIPPAPNEIKRDLQGVTIPLDPEGSYFGRYDLVNPLVPDSVIPIRPNSWVQHPYGTLETFIASSSNYWIAFTDEIVMSDSIVNKCVFLLGGLSLMSALSGGGLMTATAAGNIFKRKI